jgi:hypothetical protein
MSARRMSIATSQGLACSGDDSTASRGNAAERREPHVLFDSVTFRNGGATIAYRPKILLSDLLRRVLRRGRSDDGASTVNRVAVGRKIDAGSMNLRDDVAALERIALDEAQTHRRQRRAGGSPARARRTRRFARSRRHFASDDALARQVERTRLVTAMRFVPYAEAADLPNIVVDGAAASATVLTLSHWPKSGTPETLRADTSAEIVFKYLDAPAMHVDVGAASNNHFDEDGLIGIFALTRPNLAARWRALLVEIARAGEFGICRVAGPKAYPNPMLVRMWK